MCVYVCMSVCVHNMILLGDKWCSKHSYNKNIIIMWSSFLKFTRDDILSEASL